MAATEFERISDITEATYDSSLARRLDVIWRRKAGFIGWLSSVDHNEIGIRYIVTAFGFFILGGIEALIFRIQLAWSNQDFLTPEQYDELFTMHGVTVILWYALPILSGFSNYLFPLLLGARDMAMPASMRCPIGSGFILYGGFALGMAPNAGWFNYTGTYYCRSQEYHRTRTCHGYTP